MDIATDMDALRHNLHSYSTLRSTPASLKFEIEDLSNRIQNLINLRKTSVKSLLTLLFAKRAERQAHAFLYTTPNRSVRQSDPQNPKPDLFINLFLY